MSSEARKDELRMSWNKKVSMREIAQFYEDKLRELNAKQIGLMEEISKKEAEIEMKTRTLEGSFEDAKCLIEKLDEMIKYADTIRSMITSPYQSINAKLEQLESSLNDFQRKVDNIRSGLMNSILSQAADYSEFVLFKNFVGSFMRFSDKELLKAELSAMDDIVIRKNVYLDPIRPWIMAHLSDYPGFLEAVGQDPHNIERISKFTLSRYKEFIIKHLYLIDKTKGFEEAEKTAAQNSDFSFVFMDESGKLVERRVKIRDQIGGTSND